MYSAAQLGFTLKELSTLLGITRQAVCQSMTKYIKRNGLEPIPKRPKKKNLFVCQYCGVVFESHTSNGRIACTHDCWLEYHAAKDLPWSKHTIKQYTCDGCGAEYTRDNKKHNIAKYFGCTKNYCSQACYWENGIGKREHTSEIAD